MFVLIPLFTVVSCIGIVSTSGGSLTMQSQGKSAGSASALLGLLPFILGAARWHRRKPYGDADGCRHCISAVICFKALAGRAAQA